MKFRVTGFELSVRDDERQQRIFLVHDRDKPHPAPQLLLVLNGPEIIEDVKNGDTMELQIHPE